MFFCYTLRVFSKLQMGFYIQCKKHYNLALMFQVVKNVKKVEPESTTKKTVQETKETTSAKAVSKAVKGVDTVCPAV